MVMDRIWTDEDRKRQGEAIKNWRPWERSSGATTPEGKEAFKMNSLKHGAYSAEMKRLENLLQKIKTKK
ncbi:MAG: hypothetical protein ACK4VI_00480 [Alphaproteobacteria bacterium]